MARGNYNGSVNNKERSKLKLIAAVGGIIKSQGFSGLTISKIAKEAGLDRKLISLYFGSLENLVETYIRSKDYFISANGNAGSLMTESTNVNPQTLLKDILSNQLDFFSKETEMQEIILWQLNERSNIMYEMAEEREKLGAAFFDLADPVFEGSSVDIRAISGLLVAGIYYMVLHAKSNDSLFCQIDIKTKKGIDRVRQSVSQIIDAAFDRAKKDKA